MCWLTCVCDAHNACAAHRPGAAAAAATADRNNDLAHLLVQLTFFVVYCRRRRSGQRTRFRRGRDRRLEPHDACALRLLRLHIVLPSPWRKCVIRARACIALLRICIRVCARLGIALEWLHCACAGVSTTAPTPTPMAATPAATSLRPRPHRYPCPCALTGLRSRGCCSRSSRQATCDARCSSSCPGCL